jgi:hypothetical protein
MTGNGRNVILEAINLLEHATVVTETIDGHVPENGGTCWELTGSHKPKAWCFCE